MSSTNILLLAMSYPQRDKIHSINDVVKLTQLNRGQQDRLETIDARDFARIKSLETLFGDEDTRCYTVSKQQGTTYDNSRHIDCDFNFHHKLFKKIEKQFGSNIKFKQIILDYVWTLNHHERKSWLPNFFKFTLPQFHKSNMLQSNSIIFLPFTIHCLSQIISQLHIISSFYTIDFLRKDELHHNLLWLATSKIDESTMLSVLGKHHHQEEKTCIITKQSINQNNYPDNITKNTAINYIKRINHFNDIRFIKLKPVTSFQDGGFIGLSKTKDSVVNGLYSSTTVINDQIIHNQEKNDAKELDQPQVPLDDQIVHNQEKNDAKELDQPQLRPLDIIVTNKRRKHKCCIDGCGDYDSQKCKIPLIPGMNTVNRNIKLAHRKKLMELCGLNPDFEFRTDLRYCKKHRKEWNMS